MTPKPEPSTQAQRHALALSRAGQRAQSSAATYFKARRGSSPPRFNTHILPQVRVPERLAFEIADFGNARGLTYSETMRALLRRGLTKEDLQ
jgi:hypothetical protein